MTQRNELLNSIRDRVQWLMDDGVEMIRLGSHREEPRPEQPSAAMPVERASNAELLKSVREELGECTRCALSRIRKKIVFGEGNPDARVLFVGEAPGFDEDRTGRPFVGRAGELLTKIIENGMDIPRGSVYICNVLKCRPPENRDPERDEVQACWPFLEAQIQAVSPKVVVCLGLPASQTLLGTNLPMHRLRGKWHAYRGIPVMPTYHPSFVLRYYTPENRRKVWEDVVEAKRRSGE